MEGLIREGVSQSEIARELGVSRQAIQKMLAC
jgi:DNA-binding transcriptional regulator LsrR (DeoR family)